MARTPKAAPPPPVPAHRGRKPKAAEPIELALAEEGGTEDAQAVEAKASTVTPVEKPARGRPGPKPKQKLEAAPAMPDEDEHPEMSLDQPDALVDQASGGDDAMIAEMAYPISTDEGSATASSQDSPGSAKPAARWDRTADTVEFDWPEIERTAAQDGPNQVMAKLLVAARAEGAHSRWPL